ncbi:ATP-binding protein [Deinococcus peraridilitoris]|uniref:NADH:ubiquinone oxidoreductase chain I-like protein n=1 Tax=Deinococcus peraridilitoris (strain DSM 19664 / LMG 22246 / CIP 109416 / KR-200) TaxID=937777 RepID=L0A5Z5_DEIPD|nr:4Fe-4S binding protein [Deinococcus peraridilitoris]AFZ68869.1 NADH:ubiquinone oxidoreductase chain I-like protein [Deinococcus peraridilitoris DSM 19664]
MLESFLKVIGEYGNPVPRYTGPRCLVERLAVGGCDLCQQICPHEAITIDARVEINDTRCTGCGLCTQVCPSGALEFDVTAALGAVREQTVPERRSVDGSVDDGAKLVCSQAGESGKTLPCLARVTSSLIVAAGAWDTPLELVHGDCADCKLGGPQVPQELQKVVEQAQQLRLATGRPAQVTVRRGNGEGAGGEAVSRRGVFGSLFRSARSVVSELVPDQPLPFVDWSVPQERVPAEWQWRRRALKPTPPPQAAVYWPAPVVDDKCILCPVCANVCPTEAIAREFAPDGTITLHLDLAACTGCDACVRSCPPDAMALQGEWAEADFAAPVLLRDSTSV